MDLAGYKSYLKLLLMKNHLPFYPTSMMLLNGILILTMI